MQGKKLQRSRRKEKAPGRRTPARRRRRRRRRKGRAHGARRGSQRAETAPHQEGERRESGRQQEEEKEFDPELKRKRRFGRKEDESGFYEDLRCPAAGTGLDRKEKVRKRVLKRAKRAARRRSKERSKSGSDSCSSEEDSLSEEELEDALFQGESKIQRVGQRCPGALACHHHEGQPAPWGYKGVEWCGTSGHALPAATSTSACERPRFTRAGHAGDCGGSAPTSTPIKGLGYPSTEVQGGGGRADGRPLVGGSASKRN